MPDNPAVGMTANAEARPRGDPAGRGGTARQRDAGAGHRDPARAHDDGDHGGERGRATARSYFMFFGTTASTPTIRTMGQYDDVLVKGERGWQLAHRVITVG